MQNWEHIKLIWTQPFWHLTHCVGCFLDLRQHWKCTHNSHPSTETERQRQRGTQSIFLVKLGCDYRVGRKGNFSMKTILQSSCCQQQQFSPSELIGVSVAVLCRRTKTKTTEKTSEEKQQRDCKEQTWSQRTGLLCHSRRVRYNQTTEGFRAKVWEQQRPMLLLVLVKLWVWIWSITCYVVASYHSSV